MDGVCQGVVFGIVWESQFEQGCVLIVGCVFNAVGHHSLSKVSCLFGVGLSLLLRIAVLERFCIRVGLLFRCCWES